MATNNRKKITSQKWDDAPKKYELSIIYDCTANYDIEQNGYYYDQNDITTTGYWTWEKVGDMVPYDFNPN